METSQTLVVVGAVTGGVLLSALADHLGRKVNSLDQFPMPIDNDQNTAIDPKNLSMAINANYPFVSILRRIDWH